MNETGWVQGPTVADGVPAQPPPPSAAPLGPPAYGSSGYWALPYPVAERLAAPTGLDTDGLVVVADNRPSAPLGGLQNSWAAVTLDGRRSTVTGLGQTRPAFVTELELAPLDSEGAGDVALGLVLPSWTLLGILDRALELTIAHVGLRKQFGQTLSSFQGVQFHSVVDIQAKYALWSIAVGRPEALDDALALRLAVLEAAEIVFRVCHQLHGAVGFCDETTLSWLSRYSQPLRRLPFGLSATRDQLTRHVGRRGLAGLYA